MDLRAEVERLRVLPKNKLSKAARAFLIDNENASAQVHKIDESIAKMQAMRAELVGVCDYTATKAVEAQRAEDKKNTPAKADAKAEKTEAAP